VNDSAQREGLPRVQAVVDGVEHRSRRWRSIRRWLGRALLTAVAIIVTGLAGFPTGRYLVRAAWEESLILMHRRDIAEVMADSGVSARTRSSLELVLAARTYAAESLGLQTGRSFTQFTQLERDTLVLVLSSAEQDALRRHTWWFPIVGRVPYKGYFDFEAARLAELEHRARGLDTQLRPASAFSTLGWFNDPLLSTTLQLDSLELVNTVIHELVHNTFYASGQAVFNESFANFAGSRGAAAFFRSREQLLAAEEVDRRWSDEVAMGSFWSGLYRAVDSAFAAHPEGRAARLRARVHVHRRWRRLLADSVALGLSTISPRAVGRASFDNAALLARRVYLTDLALFDSVLAREQGSARRAIGWTITRAKADRNAPYASVRAGLSGRAQ